MQPIRLFILATVVNLLVLVSCAQSSNASDQTPEQCKPVATSAEIIREFSAQSGSVGVPSDAASSTGKKNRSLGSITVPNDTNVVLRLTNINPFSNKCSVSTTKQAFTETAISSFLGQLGGVANVSSVTTPDAAKASGGPPAKSGFMVESIRPETDWKVLARGKEITVPSSTCVDDYMTGAHREAALLQRERDAINVAMLEYQTSQQSVQSEFNRAITDLAAANSCSDIVHKATNMAFPAPSATRSPSPSPAPPPLDERIDTVAFQTQRLLTHITDGTDACKQKLAEVIDADTAFLEALAHGTSSVPSAVDKWRDQLKALNSVSTNIKKIRSSVASTLASRKNFLIEMPIHEQQTSVTATISCSAVTLPTISSDSGSSSQPSQTGADASSSTAAAQQKAADGPTFEVRFGLGPRFVYAGGVVISPLQQVSFSTTAAPGGSGATANTIVFQQDSSTRILPIAMLHARYADLLPALEYRDWKWVPNYFSAGVTAKSTDNNGTSIEYLFGPSWGLAKRQLFITAGAYAGRQQRLQNGLAVGSTTSLGSSNLPTIQALIWKAGFAVTWAPAGK